MGFAVGLQGVTNFHLWERMTMPGIGKTHQFWWLFASALVLATLLPGFSPAQGLNQTEGEGYVQWLHSLEQGNAGRVATDRAEANLLYPFGLPAWAEIEPRPYRHLSICKALMVLEEQYQDKAIDQVSSVLVALANARNYANLTEFDLALRWYALAANLDRDGEFRREIRVETMATAAAASDSATMAGLLRGALIAADPSAHAEELVLGARWALSRDDAPVLDALQTAMAAVDSAAASPQLLFWRAYVRTLRGDHAASLQDLRLLIQFGGLSLDLCESQRAWVLTTLADGFFLAGDVQQAGDLYRILAASAIPELKVWGACQLAGLDFLAGRFLEAAQGYTQACEADRLGAWQDQACAMAVVAKELQRIRTEGEPYGTAQFFAP